GPGDGVDQWRELLLRPFVGEVAVVARAAGGDGADDLERRDDRLRGERAVLVDQPLDAVDALLRVLFAEDAERGRDRRAVGRDIPASRELQLTAARQLRHRAGLFQPVPELVVVAPSGPEREH